VIKAVDIGNFGSFKDFIWNRSIRDKGNTIGQFKRLNILYGKNYSGKTTLSRIFRALQTKELPPRFDSPAFQLTTDIGPISPSNISSNQLDVRVYNKDFIDLELSFLRDQDKSIAPFAILGGDNRAAEARIREIDDFLGSVDGKSGLRYQLDLNAKDVEQLVEQKRTAEKELNRKLTDKATKAPGGIKHNPLYRDPNYNTPKLEADISQVIASSIGELSPEDVDRLVAILKETTLPDIRTRLNFSGKLGTILSDSRILLQKRIRPSEAIQELLSDSLLQAWAKTGISLHRDKRNTCGFCGQPLPESLWQKLDNHFSKESSELEQALEELSHRINEEGIAVDRILSVSKNELYPTLHLDFDTGSNRLVEETSKYHLILSEFAKAIDRRKADIFNIVEVPAYDDNSQQLSEVITEINKVIEKHNQRSSTLESEQKTARLQLRLDEVKKFIEQIAYVKETRIVGAFDPKIQKASLEREALSRQVVDLETERLDQNKSLRDERKGADRVNEFLSSYFGHAGLLLSAIEVSGTSTYKFEIQRGGGPAYNLSEGECSLVAFCYFVAKLDDAESVGKNLIIYIDDPICSLDNNHIFFLFSLIENKIAKSIAAVGEPPAYRYKQLFISTHNLEFLKYLKRLSHPKNDSEQFIVTSNGNSSSIQLMPDYLRKYVTELNHLFGEIFNCIDTTMADDNYSSYYSFGNNLRKFLEAFLFFKYPSVTNEKQDYDARLKKFFGDEPTTEILVQRLTNEFSHLGEFPDRGVTPIDHAEISKLAKFVIRKIKQNDESQFECFLQSIGKTEPELT